MDRWMDGLMDGWMIDIPQKFIRFRFVIKVNITLILLEVKLKGTHIG